MAQEIKVADSACLMPTFERNRYFTGKPMSVSDFDAEQRYLLGKNRLQNQLIHGAGIICGLRLDGAKITDDRFSVEISEGAALDCCGNLIVVNRTDRVEVQRQAKLDGTFYLYIRYSECVRQPIMSMASATGCGEACCYNRVRESFELFITQVPPAPTTIFTGAVKTGPKAVVGARVKALQNGTLQAATLTDNSGNFSLAVGAGGSFDIDASATGFAPARRTETIAAGSSRKLTDFNISPQSGMDPDKVCDDFTQSYFEEHSRGCRHCDDPKVFLGIAKIDGNKVSVDQTSSDARDYRAVVQTNPMLHDLLCDHVSDFNNPHRTTAGQVKALQNVNGVGNSDSKADVVARIDLVSDDQTITITPHATANTISITGPAAATQKPKNVSSAADLGISKSFALEDHVHTLDDRVVERKHLSDDTVNKLVFSSDASIKVASKPGLNFGDRQIDITTKVPQPANQLPSAVSSNAGVGASTNYAREDHIHNLDDRVVERKHLSDDAINKLVFSSDASIKVATKPGLNFGDRQIDITARVPQPAGKTPSAVSLKPSLGGSSNYALEDHVHNLSSQVVIKDNFADEIVNTFVVADDASITVAPNLTARQVKIKTNPATDVSSVSAQKSVGNSLNFARQDHVHNLQINDRGPDNKGFFLLSAGDNVNIKGRAGNELVISATPGTVVSGVATFERVSQNETRISPPIHQIVTTEPFAIILGLVDIENVVTIGDLAAWDPTTPLVRARFVPGRDNFTIELRDRRPTQAVTSPMTYNVRWWAVPFNQPGAPVTSGPATG